MQAKTWEEWALMPPTRHFYVSVSVKNSYSINNKTVFLLKVVPVVGLSDGGYQ